MRPAFLAALARPFLRSEIDRLLHVAAGLAERGLAIHHARAGPFAQLLDHLVW